MDVAKYMEKHGLTDEALDAMARPYESGDWGHCDSRVFNGSHLDAVGKRRVTVVYDASATQMVARIAKSQGVKPSEVYRDALSEYLERRAAMA